MEQPCFENKGCTCLFFKLSNQLCSAPVDAPLLFSIVSPKGTEALRNAHLSLCRQRNTNVSATEAPLLGLFPAGKAGVPQVPGLGCGWFLSCLGCSAGGSSAGRSSGTHNLGCREMAVLNGCLRLGFTTPSSKQDKQIHLPLGSIILNTASCIKFISQERWADAGSAAGGTAVQPGEG